MEIPSAGQGEVSPPAGPCPWLVFDDGEGYKTQTFCCNITGPPSSSVKMYPKRIPVLQNKKVVCCSHGKLVLLDVDTKLLSLCNSTTFDDIISLPSLHHLSNYGIDTCLLLDNKLDDLMVVIFLESFPSIVCCSVGSESEWSEIAYGEQLNAYFPDDLIEKFEHAGVGPLFFSRAAVICDSILIVNLQIKRRDCFFLTWVIEIVEEEERLGLVLFFAVGAPNGTFRGPQTPINVYLLESCGEIFCLYFFTKALAFEVYRLNFDDLVFERVKDVRDIAFFVGERYCLSCPISGPGLIYFTTYGDTDNLYCFYTHDDSITASPLPCPLLSSPTWMFCNVMAHDMPLRLEENHCNKGIISKQGKNSTTQSIWEFDENGEQGKRLRDLPLDMFEEVSKHLVAFDYLSFRGASKIFRSVAPPISWRRALSEGLGAYNFSCPLLMFANRAENVYKFVDPNINSSSYNYYLMRIPDSLQIPITICYSHQGWLLLLKPLRAVHLYNPFTRDIISCNRRYGEGVEESTFFYSKPSAITTSNGDCPIISVGFFEEKKTMVKVISPRPGDEIVRHFDVESDRVFKVESHLTSPALFQDAFYYLDKQGRLGKLKITDLSVGDNLSWEVLDKPQCPDGLIDSSYHNYLVECGGELISVFVGRLGKWVSVYRLNGDEEAWETVTDLGGYDLYLSPSSSLSVLTKTRGNRIYCPWLRGSEIVFFSLDTGKWHFSGSGDSSCDLYGTRMHLNSCWVMPTW
ncbi:unnamed protein product [Cuscuta campestris]|uniref:KIB1-4 beta-propeller domain-containing protein n=1 Tax=Cuscuta campestris TaxID=132261 RepID=A0A484M5W7_9ASTE|nr:unnamed protein product [Cuscuta campestris]